MGEVYVCIVTSVCMEAISLMHVKHKHKARNRVKIAELYIYDVCMRITIIWLSVNNISANYLIISMCVMKLYCSGKSVFM